MTTLEWDPAPAPSERPPGGQMPWGPKQFWIGLAAGVGIFFLVSVVAAGAILVLDLDGTFEDIGGPLVKAEEIANYAEERYRAALEGSPLPDPPGDIVADIATLRVVFGITLLQQIGLVVISVVIAGVGWAGWVRATGLGHYRWTGIWRPAVGTGAMYLIVIGYSIAMQAIGIDLLIPESTVPIEVTRDGVTLALIGVLTIIGAPLSEEFFFRGLLFGALTRWGFWPAAFVSGFIFAAIHLDPGSVIPFTLVGVVFAWLYWHRRSLWDALIGHAIFNGVSFLLLLSQALAT